SGNEQLDRLSQLKGKRIAVGPVGSATRYTAEQILGRGGINAENSTLLPFGGSTGRTGRKYGKVDAGWVSGVARGAAGPVLFVQPQGAADELSDGRSIHAYLPRSQSPHFTARRRRY